MTNRRKEPLSALTRYFVVPLLILAIGIRIGMYLGKGRPAPAPAPAQARAAPAPSLQPTPEPESPPEIELRASFQDNIYPSLLLSLSAAYPEYARCLTVSVRNLPYGAAAEVRIESELFERPATAPIDASQGAAAVSPALPWNFDRLRRVTQDQPQTFVATVVIDGKPGPQASLVCTVHSVNEAVSRIASAPGQWQDTSVCFAAFVNEDHPWINTLLQEAEASGGAKAFSGYQAGPQGVTAQVQAIWDTLAAKGLTYVNVATDSAASSQVATQYVRFLDQSVRDQGANCVDASVLFCSVLRRIGLRPVLIFRPGHCFAGYYEAPDSARIVAFETTLLGQAGFSAALNEGARELQATAPFLGNAQYSIVDIALCRQQGVSPIAYQAP